MNNAIPELLEKINHLRQKAESDEAARQKLALLRRVLTCSMMGTLPGPDPVENPEDAMA